MALLAMGIFLTTAAYVAWTTPFIVADAPGSVDCDLPEQLTRRSERWRDTFYGTGVRMRVHSALERAFPEYEWTAPPRPIGSKSKIVHRRLCCKQRSVEFPEAQLVAQPSVAMSEKLEKLNHEVREVVRRELAAVISEMHEQAQQIDAGKARLADLRRQASAAVGCSVAATPPRAGPYGVLQFQQQQEALLREVVALSRRGKLRGILPDVLQVGDEWRIDCENRRVMLKLDEPERLAEMLQRQPTASVLERALAERRELQLRFQAETGVRVEIRSMDVPRVTPDEMRACHEMLRSSDLLQRDLHVLRLSKKATYSAIESAQPWNWRRHNVELKVRGATGECRAILARVPEISEFTQEVRNLQKQLAVAMLALNRSVFTTRGHSPAELLPVARRLRAALNGYDANLSPYLTSIEVDPRSVQILGQWGYHALTVDPATDTLLDDSGRDVQQVLAAMHHFATVSIEVWHEADRLQAALQELLGAKLVVRPSGAAIDDEVVALRVVVEALQALQFPPERPGRALLSGQRAIQRVTVTDFSHTPWWGFRAGELRVPATIQVKPLLVLLDRSVAEDYVVQE